MDQIKKSYEALLRIFPDFPKSGIQFIDWMPVLNSASAFKDLIHDAAEMVREGHFTKVVGIESRGFMFGCPLALELGLPFVPVRKKGKLPGPTIQAHYHLEYGDDCMEVQEGMITEDDNVLIVDDLLATGGSSQGANDLIKRFTTHFQDLFILELMELRGGTRLDCPYQSIIKIYGVY